MPRRIALILGALLIAHPAITSARPAFCPDGRFAVAGGGLIPDDPDGSDVVALTRPEVAIGIACAPAEGKVRARRRATRIRAALPGCEGITGRARLRARIAVPACDTMSGKLRARGGIRRSFTATRVRCCDGHLDSTGDEECEMDVECPVNAVCVDCRCVLP